MGIGEEKFRLPVNRRHLNEWTDITSARLLCLFRSSYPKLL